MMERNLLFVNTILDDPKFTIEFHLLIPVQDGELIIDHEQIELALLWPQHLVCLKHSFTHDLDHLLLSVTHDLVSCGLCLGSVFGYLLLARLGYFC